MPYRWIMEAPDQPLKKVDFDLPELQAGEVVVAVAGCGVCHTDLGFYYDGVRTNQPLPLALGHEISGHVTEAGPGAEDMIGQAVVIPAVMPCGECDACQRGKGTICPNQKMPGNDMHGGFASHIVVPARGLCPVEESRLEKAGLVLADVSVLADAVTTPYQAVSQAEMRPGALAVVIGAGGVGGYCVQIAKAFGARVVALDIDPAKLEQAEAAGAELTLDVRDKSGKELKKAIIAYAKEHDLPTREWAIFECSGSAPGQQTAYDLLVHGASLSIVGFTMAKVEVRLSNLMAFHARALGNWGCVPDYYPPALDMVLDGKINLRDFVEQHPLDSINDVFDKAHRHELTRRAILIP